MTKQELIEKLAKEMCMAVNAKATKDYMEHTSLHLNALYDEQHFTHQATTAVELFWPLVEAADQFRSYGNVSCAKGDLLCDALSTLEEK